MPRVVQALGDDERQSFMKGKRILEINPRHPLIRQVKDKFEADPENNATSGLAKILYETALLESGFQVRSLLQMYSRKFHKDLSLSLLRNLSSSLILFFILCMMLTQIEQSSQPPLSKSDVLSHFMHTCQLEQLHCDAHVKSMCREQIHNVRADFFLCYTF